MGQIRVKKLVRLTEGVVLLISWCPVGSKNHNLHPLWVDLTQLVGVIERILLYIYNFDELFGWKLNNYHRETFYGPTRKQPHLVKWSLTSLEHFHMYKHPSHPTSNQSNSVPYEVPSNLIWPWSKVYHHLIFIKKREKIAIKLQAFINQGNKISSMKWGFPSLNPQLAYK